MSDEAIRNHLSQFGAVRSSRGCKLQTMPGIFNGISVFAMEISKPIPSFLRFGRYLVPSKHKDQIPTCRKCNRPGHQARKCPYIFCFNCEELGHMTDSCPDEIHCCICRVTGHMAADCPYSWNRRSSVLRSDNSDTHLQQPSQLSATTAQSSQQSTERSEVISPEQFSQSSDQSTQSSQRAFKSTESLQLSSDSQSLLPSQRSSLSTQLSQELSNLLVWTLKLCPHNSLCSLLVSHHTVPRILPSCPSMLPTHILCNLLRKP